MDMYSFVLQTPVKDEAELKELLDALGGEKCIETAEPDRIIHID